jgi:hypothetical protein
MSTSRAALSQELTPQKLSAMGAFTPSQVDRVCAEDARTQFLVEGFLPVKSIAIVAGDSGLGKSALMYQQALCIAAGIPFLGMPTKQGRVLYFDSENSLDDGKLMRDSLVRFLGLERAAEDFIVVPEPGRFASLVEQIKPSSVVIDSLRANNPEVTSSNGDAGTWLKEKRALAHKHDFALQIVHHLRKPGRQDPPHDLDSETRVTNWTLEMEGARALVNQTDVRIAIAEGDFNPAALKVKWSRRVHGDSPLFLLERVCDEDGEPAGYRLLTGAALLNAQRREALAKLAEEFSFKDAKRAYGRSDDPTNKFLKECKQLGLVVREKRGVYRKVLPPESALPGNTEQCSTTN